MSRLPFSDGSLPPTLAPSARLQQNATALPALPARIASGAAAGWAA